MHWGLLTYLHWFDDFITGTGRGQNDNFQFTLQWCHNGCDSISNHQPYHCLLNLLFRRRSKETSKLRVTGLCEGNSPGTGEFPAQMASYAENVSIWWRHHVGHDENFIKMANISISVKVVHSLPHINMLGYEQNVRHLVNNIIKLIF